jgi:hypothetical protein
MTRLVMVGALLLAAISLGLVDAAFALGNGGTSPAPAPLIGVGGPIAGAVVATLYLVRRFRRRG